MSELQPSRRAAISEAVDRVVSVIEEDIIFGRLLPRERLIEDALIERLKAKRHVVRQALSTLERQGMVIRHRNRGSAVRHFSLEEVENIYAMREILQGAAACRIPLPAPLKLIRNLTEIHTDHSAAADRGDLRLVYRLNNLFHETLFGACGNPYLADEIARYAWLSHAIRSYRIADPNLLRQARDEHAQMIEALRESDRAGLVRLCVDHIKPSKDAYLANEENALRRAI